MLLGLGCYCHISPTTETSGSSMDKKHILDEIVRTARENDGRPLGRRRFGKETGIKESDWLGLHWARWGDAIREAGFEPNQMVVSRDEEELIEDFISLMRKLSRFPTSAEIQMERRSGSTTLPKNVFDRFGSKSNLARRIADYCSDKPDFDNIVAMCVVADDSNENLRPDVETAQSSESFGFVYLMKSGRHYKIGRSNSVGRREYELAIQLPRESYNCPQNLDRRPGGHRGLLA